MNTVWEMSHGGCFFLFLIFIKIIVITPATTTTTTVCSSIVSRLPYAMHIVWEMRVMVVKKILLILFGSLKFIVFWFVFCFSALICAMWFHTLPYLECQEEQCNVNKNNSVFDVSCVWVTKQLISSFYSQSVKCNLMSCVSPLFDICS